MKHFFRFVVVVLLMTSPHSLAVSAFAGALRAGMPQRSGVQNLFAGTLPTGRATELLSVRNTSLAERRLRKTAATSDLEYFPDTVTVFSTYDTARYSVTYNAKGWPTTQLVEVGHNGTWTNYARFTYSLDANGNSITHLEEYWSGSKWVSYILKTWTYDADSNSVEITQTRSGNTWVNTSLDSSTYDAAGNMLFHMWAAWQNGHWRDSISSLRTYDADENMLTNQSWQTVNGVWTNYDTSAYTYDSGGNELTRKYWFWQDSNWDLEEQESYTYDASGNVLTDVLETGSGGVQTGGVKTIFTYDASDVLLSALEQTWKNGAWSDLLQVTFTHDSFGNLLSGTSSSTASANPADYTFLVPLNGVDYSFTGYAISISYTGINPSDVSTQAKGIAAHYSLSQNYPNPFNPATVISGQWSVDSRVRLVVYDMLGREVAVLADGRYPAGEHFFTFDAKGLASGVYFYRLTAGNFVQTRRMLLIR